MLLATVAVVSNNLSLALMLMMGAVLADVLDGIAARKFGSSNIRFKGFVLDGTDLDKVADFYSFAICGSIILATALNTLEGILVAVLFGLGCGYRLLYKQVATPAVFCGLPVPAAMLVAFIPLFLELGGIAHPAALPFVIIATFLMVVNCYFYYPPKRLLLLLALVMVVTSWLNVWLALALFSALLCFSWRFDWHQRAA